MNRREEATIRCGYCQRIFPKIQSTQHWTWSRCNYRPELRR